MLQTPDYSARMRTMKRHSLNAPESQKTEVWKITRLKNSNRASLAKIVAFFLPFPNMMGSGPEVKTHVLKGLQTGCHSDARAWCWIWFAFTEGPIVTEFKVHIERIQPFLIVLERCEETWVHLASSKRKWDYVQTSPNFHAVERGQLFVSPSLDC